MSFSEDNTTLASISPEKGVIRLWDFNKRASLDNFTISLNDHVLTSTNGSVTLIPGGGLAIQIGKMLYFSAAEKGDIQPIFWSDRVACYAISPDGATLATVEPEPEFKENSGRLYIYSLKAIVAGKSIFHSLR